MMWRNGYTEERSLLIGNKVGSSAIKPAATIGIMAVKILLRDENGDTREIEKKNINSRGSSFMINIVCFVILDDSQRHSPLASHVIKKKTKQKKQCFLF